MATTVARCAPGDGSQQHALAGQHRFEHADDRAGDRELCRQAPPALQQASGGPVEGHRNGAPLPAREPHASAAERDGPATGAAQANHDAAAGGGLR